MIQSYYYTLWTWYYILCIAYCVLHTMYYILCITYYVLHTMYYILCITYCVHSITYIVLHTVNIQQTVFIWYFVLDGQTFIGESNRATSRPSYTHTHMHFNHYLHLTLFDCFFWTDRHSLGSLIVRHHDHLTHTHTHTYMHSNHYLHLTLFGCFLGRTDIHWGV